MSRELRHRSGLIKYAPNPLENSPVLRLLEAHRGETYNIYIDESMRSFFGFNQPDGYLCYAAVGIPEAEYEFFKRSMIPIFQDYERMVTGDPDVHLDEFKFDRFRYLSSDEREALAKRIQKVFKTYGCFVTAFYTKTRGVVMEGVRSALVGEQDRVPQDHSALYELSAGKLREEASEGIAQSETITSILRISLAGLAHFMRYFGCPFRLFCDPRESSEDKAVLQAIGDFFSGPMNVIAHEESSLYLGMDNARPSDEEIGLQMADLLTGEVRLFFESNQDFVNFGSNLTLITSSSREDLEMWIEEFGVHHKFGSLVGIPSALMNKLVKFDGGSCIPLYRSFFAAGLMSCYTNFGQPRHIEVYEGNFFQQVD
jgi:hypothetical protein